MSSCNTSGPDIGKGEYLPLAVGNKWEYSYLETVIERTNNSGVWDERTIKNDGTRTLEVVSTKESGFDAIFTIRINKTSTVEVKRTLFGYETSDGSRIDLPSSRSGGGDTIRQGEFYSGTTAFVKGIGLIQKNWVIHSGVNGSRTTGSGSLTLLKHFVKQ